LWAFCLVAFGSHLLFTQLGGFREEERVSRPLTTQFVKRQPRLTKPLELKKVPKPKRRHLQRQMVSVKARLASGKPSMMVAPIQALGGLARPRPDLARWVGLAQAVSEPQAVAAVVEGSREPADKVDMALEMMDVEALDTGRYQALVVLDPSDRRNIRGFLHLAYVYPAGITAQYGGQWLFVHYPRAIRRLAQFMDAHTDIRTDFQGLLTFESSEMLGLPWIYISPNDMEDYQLTQGEAEALGGYLATGGFVFGDYSMPVQEGGAWLYVQQYPALLKVLQDGLAARNLWQGRDWQLEGLPSGHPVLHCYYDFDSPPPGYDTRHRSYGYTFISQPWRILPYEGRTLAVIGGHFYGAVWVAFGVAPSYESLDPTREFQFGVNTIIFALTQEGSVTNRLMDSVSY
jgi:hypothetical protein